MLSGLQVAILVALCALIVTLGAMGVVAIPAQYAN